MIRSIDEMIDDVLRREGGFVFHNLDRGGATKFGVTQAALSRYRGKLVTVGDVRDLTEAEARNLYRNDYLTSVQLHRIHDPYVLCLAFDCSVNHGPQRVIRWLQQIVGVIDDGILGDSTEIAVNSYEPVRLYHRLLARRIVFYGEIISRDHSQSVFCLGWMRRVAEFLETP